MKSKKMMGINGAAELEVILGSNPASQRTPTKSKAQLQDDSIMGTNNSSIVSKRSVERLYFPDEPHFFRYFVKKPQRRSPLINRGYWLRMKAIDGVVKQFLEQKSEKRKIVINLGCGYDPLPWQCFTRYPCANTTFVDIDYRDLMLKKRAVVQANTELNLMLTNIEISEGDVLFRSDQYLQLGCDLRNIQAFNDILSAAVDIENCVVLLVAEVSITYMNIEGADALIGWASKLPEARFCLLEQLLPDGIDHPFSQTMMAHFNKLSTPINAVQKYPTTVAQQNRFKGLGWDEVTIRNLWELWGASDFLSPEERKALDHIEPFDEWEEFALFGCHYFLLVADTKLSTTQRRTSLPLAKVQVKHCTDNGSEIGLDARYNKYPKTQGRRRFAAALSLKGPRPSQARFGVFGGMGLVSRMNSYDEFTLGTTENEQPTNTTLVPSSRMCHTITDIGAAGALLVGGRTSPDNGLRDCWLYHKWLNIWERVGDLPVPLYRHQAVRIGLDCVLVSSGRTDSWTISSDFFIWSRCNGWTRCHIGSKDLPVPTFGSLFFLANSETSKDQECAACGIISGGMAEDTTLLSETWIWELKDYTTLKPIIEFKKTSVSSDLVPRFGAEAIPWNDQIFILGGIIKDRMLLSNEEICVVKVEDSSISVSRVNIHGSTVPRSLLIGSTSVVMDDRLVVTGGSCVCFSFGSWWNDGSLTLSLSSAPSNDESGAEIWHYLRTVEAEVPNQAKATILATTSHGLKSLPRTRVSSPNEFLSILDAARPVVIEGLDIGECTSKWTQTYLIQQIGKNREVVVHESLTNHMDFKTKNFSYVSRKFGEFMTDIEAGQKLYLRSLSSQSPSELPAHLATDFPTIAADFQLPPELSFVSENAHSSPLRVSGPVNMWLHFDVMANVLCQIQGSKRMLLFPPSDATNLKFEPGSSSSSINAFEALYNGALGDTHPHEALLDPGDVIFLPPLWLHTASPTSTVSISVNVFFKNLANAYAAGKDTYGNRDLRAYEKGRVDIAKIVKSFDGLPTDVRNFYLQRLADEFMQKVS